jgi:hypothetical protein
MDGPDKPGHDAFGVVGDEVGRCCERNSSAPLRLCVNPFGLTELRTQ